MSYVSANKYLLRFNLLAIKRGNELDLQEVLRSVVRYLIAAYPYESPRRLRLAYYLVKTAIFLVFVLSCGRWIGLWLRSRGQRLLRPEEAQVELVLAMAIGIFLYATAITCTADMGKPSQRGPVLFSIPIVLGLMMVKRRSNIRNSSEQIQ